MKQHIAIIATIIALLYIPSRAQAQPEGGPTPQIAPIPWELTFTGSTWTSQLIIDKKFTPDGNLGLFALTYIKANYDNDHFLQESANLAMLKYDVYKNFSVLSGALVNSNWGFRPYAGAQYAYHTRTFMGFINSGFHLTETKNFETIAMLEYRPPINETWSVYSRLQGMYSQNTVDGTHDRSHIYGRLGLSYKTFSLGAAYNYDCYGPIHLTDSQFGVFVSALIF